MAIFDQIIGGLTGERSLRRVRDRSIEATRQMYDPSQLDPMADVARRQATQGIDEERYRRPVLNRLFRPVMDASVFGGNQAAAIAGTATADAGRAQALAGFESELMGQDVAARQAGAAQLGAVQAQQNQMSAMGRAMTGQIRAEFEAEKDNRRRQLASSVVNFGIQAAGGAGAIGSAIGGGVNSRVSEMFANREAALRAKKRAESDRNLPFGTPFGDEQGGFDFKQEIALPTASGLPFFRRVVPGEIPGVIGQIPSSVTATSPTAPTPGASTITNPFVNPYRTEQPSPEFQARMQETTRPPRVMQPWPTELFENLPRALTVGLVSEVTRPGREQPFTVDTFTSNPRVESQVVSFIRSDPRYADKLTPEVRQWLAQRHPNLFSIPRR